MRGSSWCLAIPLFTTAAVALAWEGPETPLPKAEPVTEEEIVVTGRKGAAAVEPDAVEVLRSFCFDPARRNRGTREPEPMSRWFPLEPPARRQFKILDAATPAYGLADALRAHELWLKLERLARPGGLVEDRCTLLVVGGRDHRRFVADMGELFRGSPTQRHVGHPHGTASLPGWEQWLWTGRPQRGSSNWRSIPAGRGAGGQSWVVVLDSSFYRDHDYVYGDLKIRDRGSPLSVLTFGVVRQPAKGNPRSGNLPGRKGTAGTAAAAREPR